ncbi:CotH kinase family protein [Priestia aryabhattai]|uniref:CotH kinase family protein n=1 Tax=Priestia TaxID=2800373 RepID=UPI001C8E6AAF|nr:CotH kinase family protein [Priestia aryabhattai]MBY0073914.1 CotH kinase family protein [Priestia aryabhattai]
MKQKEIPQYALFVNVKDLKEMQRDIWSEEAVQATMKFNKKRYDIDLLLRGSHIRKMKKKSYYIEFYSPKIFQRAKEIHLNAEYKDPSLMRNKLSLDFFSSLDVLSPHSQFVTLKINGKNEGIYLQLESVDELFLKKRNLADGSIFYAVDGDANFSLMSDLDKKPKTTLLSGYEDKAVREGDEEKLEKFIFNINTWTNTEFEQNIEKYLNVDRYLSWLVGIICMQNYDGFVHNYALYLNHESGRFELIPWDYDATWGRDVNGKVMEGDYVRAQGFNTLTARLLAVNSIKKRYIQKMNNVLNNQFTIEYMKPIIYQLHEYIAPYVLKDPYVKDNLEQFYKEPEFMLSFIKERTAYIQNNLLTL